jgi:hypothetical protein
VFGPSRTREDQLAGPDRYVSQHRRHNVRPTRVARGRFAAQASERSPLGEQIAARTGHSCRSLRKPRLLTVCMVCNLCRPCETYVHVGFVTPSERE